MQGRHKYQVHGKVQFVIYNYSGQYTITTITQLTIYKKVQEDMLFIHLKYYTLFLLYSLLTKFQFLMK